MRTPTRYTQPVTLGEIAEDAQVRVSDLAASFRKYFPEAFHTRIRYIRDIEVPPILAGIFYEEWINQE